MTETRTDSDSINWFITSGIVVGIGMGGFIDGILFHQLLQLHHMLSAKLPVKDIDPDRLVVNLEINMFWDGVFHASTWLVTATGIGMLLVATSQPGPRIPSRVFIGASILGWGIFNFVEGLIDHHILHLHHVAEIENRLKWDLIFLSSGPILAALGWYLVRSALSHREQHLYDAQNS